MKKNLKYIICIFFMFITITLFNNSNVIEVETEVKGKMSTQSEINSCLNNKVFGTIRSFTYSDGSGIKDEAYVKQEGNKVGSYSQSAKYIASYDQTGGKKITKVVVEIVNFATDEKVCSFSYEAGQTYAGVTFPAEGAKAVKIELGFGLIANKYGVGDYRIYSSFYYDGEKKHKYYGAQAVRFKSKGPDFWPNEGSRDYRVPLAEYDSSTGKLCFSTWMAEKVKDFKAVWGVNAFNSSDTYPEPQGNFTDFKLSYTDGTKGRLIKACSNNKIDISKVYTMRFVDITDADGYGNKNSSGIGKYIHPNTLAAHTTTTTEPQTSYAAETTTNKKVVNTDDGDTPLGGFGNIVSNSKLECDSGFAEIIDEAWNIILICAPILTILMGTIGFVQALLSSDADGIKKASSDLIKRAVALLLLMLLKIIISVILNLFGINICF